MQRAAHLFSVYNIYLSVRRGGGGSAAHDLNITNKLFGRIFFYVCEVVRRVVVCWRCFFLRLVAVFVMRKGSEYV